MRKSVRRSILNNYAVAFLILGITLSSCASRKRAAKGVSETGQSAAIDNSIKTFEMSNLNYFTFSGRAKAKITLDNASHDATAHIRMERDKAIWISVTALLNIEVARVLITPDSIKIQTKYPKKELIARRFSYIHQFVNPNLTFRSLQDILVGNLSTELLRSGNVQVASSTDDVVIIGSRDNLLYQYGMNDKNRPYATKIEDKQLAQVLDVGYNDYTSTEGHLFPQRFLLEVRGEGLNLKADLRYNRLTFNEKIEMPF